MTAGLQDQIDSELYEQLLNTFKSSDARLAGEDPQTKAIVPALCILPDYIGLGSSAKHPDLYLNHEVHGRTSVDALLTLLDFAKARKLPLDSNYKTTIFGYSQGGSVSLASLRRVQELDAATQSRLHLQHVQQLSF